MQTSVDMDGILGTPQRFYSGTIWIPWWSASAGRHPRLSTLQRCIPARDSSAGKVTGATKPRVSRFDGSSKGLDEINSGPLSGRWQKKEDKPASSGTLVNPRGHAGIIGGVFTISIVSTPRWMWLLSKGLSLSRVSRQWGPRQAPLYRIPYGFVLSS